MRVDIKLLALMFLVTMTCCSSERPIIDGFYINTIDGYKSLRHINTQEGIVPGEETKLAWDKNHILVESIQESKTQFHIILLDKVPKTKFYVYRNGDPYGKSDWIKGPYDFDDFLEAKLKYRVSSKLVLSPNF